MNPMTTSSHIIYLTSHPTYITAEYDLSDSCELSNIIIKNPADEDITDQVPQSIVDNLISQIVTVCKNDNQFDVTRAISAATADSISDDSDYMKKSEYAAQNIPNQVDKAFDATNADQIKSAPFANNETYYGKDQSGVIGFHDLPAQQPQAPEQFVGDMEKVVYDTNDSGVVDSAEKIEGIDSISTKKYYGTDDNGNPGFFDGGADGQDGADGAQGPQGIQGEKGDQGDQGPQGFTGPQGAEGVQGEKGDQGDQGVAGQDGADGTNGVDGQDGDSAYQIWLNNGNTGSEQDFLDEYEKLTEAEITAFGFTKDGSKFQDYTQEDITGFRNRTVNESFLILQSAVASAGSASAGIFIGEDAGGASDALDENFGIRFIARNLVIDSGDDLVETNRIKIFEFSKVTSKATFFGDAEFQKNVNIEGILNVLISALDVASLTHSTILNASNLKKRALVISRSAAGHSWGSSLEVTGGNGGNQSAAFAPMMLFSFIRSDQAFQGSFFGNMGNIIFGANHTTGGSANVAYTASIGAVGDNVLFSDINTMPTNLVFRTGSQGKASGAVNTNIGTERMRIDSLGNVTIYEDLFVSDIVADNLDLTNKLTADSAEIKSTDFKVEDDNATYWRIQGGVLSYGHTGLGRNYLNITNNAANDAVIEADRRFLMLRSKNSTVRIQSNLDGGGTGDNNSIQFLNGATEAARFQAEKFGIGTATPEGLLHLKSLGDVVMILEADSDNSGENDNPKIVFKQDGAAVVGSVGFLANSGSEFTNSVSNAMYLHNEFASALQFAVEGKMVATIRNDRLGILNNNPTHPLDVSGIARISSKLILGNSFMELNQSGGNAGTGADVFMSGSGVIAAGLSLNINIGANNTNAGDLVIGKNTNTNSAAVLLRVQNDGKVRIGTGAAQEKLDVDGNALISGNVTIDEDLFVEDIVANDIDATGDVYATGSVTAIGGVVSGGEVFTNTLRVTNPATDTTPTHLLTRDQNNNLVKEIPIGEVLATHSYAYQRTADQNLNTASWTKLIFDTEIGSLVTLNSTDLTVLTTGVYDLTFAAQLTSTGQRSSVECAIFIGTNQLSPSDFSYIRNVNGLDKDSVRVQYKGTIAANEVISVQFRRHGTVTANCILANLPTTGAGSINAGRANCQLDILKVG